MKARAWGRLGLLMVGLATPGAALAQGAPCAQPEVVKALKEQGDRAMDAARPADALTAYQQAYAACRGAAATAPPLSGAGGEEGAALVYNLGRAHLGTGDYAQALTYFEEFERLASPALRAKVPALRSLIDEQRARVGSVAVTTNVRGAHVRLRDKPLGEAPLAATRVNAGKAVIEVTAEGHRPFSRELDIRPGTTVNVEATLTSLTAVLAPAPPTPQMGTLGVRSPVDAAVVFVDGQPYGRAPVEVKLPPGSHRVVVHQDGYRDADQQVSLSAGERRDLSLTPEKEGSVLGKWWLWTAVGAVAAAGVVTTLVVAGNTEKSPPTPDGQLGIVQNGKTLTFGF